MNLIKSTGTFGFYTVISRLLGYLRDILIAIFLGTGLLADAFFVAFRIPNTFRRLFAEGTFNAAFVPSYSSEIRKGKKESNNFANDIFNLLFLGLLFLTILIVVFNLTQLNVYDLIGVENRIALICFILSLCALILVLILMISKRIKDRHSN